jgi:hypothetical protein
MDKVKVIKVDEQDNLELYCKYQTEHSPQGCIVELYCDDDTLTATFDAHTGGSFSIDVCQNRVLNWAIPCLLPRAANSLLEEIKPHAQEILNGYDVEWNGNNFVGVFTDEADKARNEIEELCEAAFYSIENQVIVWEAGDWLAEVDPADVGIQWDTTDEELKKIEEQIIEEALGENVYLLEGLEDEIRSMRDELYDERIGEEDEE